MCEALGNSQALKSEDSSPISLKGFDLFREGAASLRTYFKDNNGLARRSALHLLHREQVFADFVPNPLEARFFHLHGRAEKSRRQAQFDLA
jgi:hypothetical protein